MSGSRPEADTTQAPGGNQDDGGRADSPDDRGLMGAAGDQDAGDNADSPPADNADGDGQETKESLLDAIRKAVPDEGSPPDDAGKPAEAAKAEGDKPADQAKADGDDGDDASVPFHAHPRWQKVLGERNDLRRQVAELEPGARIHREMLNYMDRHGLVPDEVQKGFAIMAALKTDPAAAWELMKPYVDAVQAHMGQTLPDDLRQRVDDGLVDEDTARELARARNNLALRERAAARQHEQQRTVAAAAQIEGTVNAVNEWAVRQQSDPDYASIAPLLEGEILRLQREWSAAGKQFNTPEGAVTLSQAAYDGLRARLRPTRQLIRSTPSSSRPAAKPPATMMDAMRQALGG